MEFGINKKIKIVWICQFSNEHVQDKLPLYKKSPICAAWITNTLEGFKNNDEYEIHVLSPHLWLKRDFSFEENGIFYHFYKIGIPIISRNWPSFFRFDIFTNFYFNRKKISSIVYKIRPNLINVQGAENSHYSSVVLDLYKKYPILLTIQGFISLDVYSKNDFIKRNRIKLESKVINACRYFGGDADSELIIKQMGNKDFSFFNYYYPINANIEKLNKSEVIKDYDLMFWSRIVQDKGAEDFLLLISNLVIDFPDLKAIFIGPVSDDYFSYLKDKSKELGCFENIFFRGFIESEQKLYEEVLKAKILVIPTYNDRFPTVLREAVCLKIAVIAYATGSIPVFNYGDERILLTEQAGVNQLTSYAKKLLANNDYYNALVHKAYEHGIKEFSIKDNCERMAMAYKEILKQKQKNINY
ncbi:MAG: glycosyltransferase [Flavobacterium sp.]|nr:glycosyltransferase [Flavobacterium sp.]